MKITFLGVSGALSEGHNSNMLIDTVDNRTLLFDAGITLKQSLKDANRSVSDIDAVYISHLHSDHCGSMEWLGYYSHFMMSKRIILYIHESMVSDLWSMLRPGMEKMDGKPMRSLDDYFRVEAIKDDDGFEFGMRPYVICFKTVRQDHVETPNGNMYSYGLKIGESDRDGWQVFISSDSKRINMPCTYSDKEKLWTSLLMTEYEYDYIFCDCDVMNLDGVHPNYNDLKKYDADTKSKMWLYHYTNLDDYKGEFGKMPDAVADGFAGFVKEGQIFKI